MNLFFLTTASEVVEKTTDFFSEDNLKKVIHDLEYGTWGLLQRIVISILIYYIGKIIIKYLVKLTDKALSRTSLDRGVIKFLCSFLRFGAYVILAIQIIGRLGFQTASILTLLGSAGLAFGLALQGSLSNFAGGILILIFKPFRLGDYIIVGTNEGTVKVIDLLYTKLLTSDNKIITIPNGSLANSSIVNVGSEQVRRVDITIPVGYSSDIQKAKSLLDNILRSQDEIILDKGIEIIVTNYQINYITLETHAWVNTSDYWNIRCRLLEKYKEVFDANEIEFPVMKFENTK